jgi:hypothetical protein
LVVAFGTRPKPKPKPFALTAVCRERRNNLYLVNETGFGLQIVYRIKDPGNGVGVKRRGNE